ncbi:hypothetical protein DP49_5691 [Burkholderia pseudomallei]|nr:hypothetical protein DP49_5691 [Burkholderia pseudomallei]
MKASVPGLDSVVAPVPSEPVVPPLPTCKIPLETAVVPL